MPRLLHLDDLPRLPVVSQPALSRDGRRYACAVTTWDLEKDCYRSRVWLGETEGSEPPRPATSGEKCDTSPCFSPDGRYLLFLSDRTEEQGEASKAAHTTNLWALDLEGGEAVRLTRLPGSCSRPSWSPDGRRVLFLFQPKDPEPPTRSERVRSVLRAAGEELPPAVAAEVARERANVSAHDDERAAIAHRVRRLHWREDGRGILPQARAQLWTLDIGALRETPLWRWAPAALEDARLARLTAGPYDVSDPAFSPDGTRVAFVSNRSADPDRLSGLFDLWIVPADSGATGGGQPERWDEPASGIVEPRRVPAPVGPKAVPSWSPDGTRLAYIAHTEPLDVWGTTNYHVWEASVDGTHDARDLTPDFDRTASPLVLDDLSELVPYAAPIWRDGGSEVLFLATDRSQVRPYAVSAEGGEPRVVYDLPESLGSLAASADGRRLAFVAAGFTSPPEVWSAEGARLPAPLTSFTRAWREELRLSEPQLVPVSSPEGHTLDAWVLRPPDFDPARRYPLLLQIHGGPYAAYGHVFVYEFHWLAAQGYCVLFANPRGSQGYGYDFAAPIRKDLAAPAHRDLMAAVDLVAGRPYVDRERLGVTGGSWGGYMTNWIVTQTERFRAALAQRSISDFETDFGVADYGYEVEWMFGGPPWTHREVYERCSPLTYVENVRTPLLLLHSDQDWRCPPSQAEIFYGALKMLGREVEMVRFPNESHGLSRSGTPSRRLERLRVIAEWFERHLGPPSPHRDGARAAPEPVPEEAAAT